jgi:hypothetical protein
MLPGSFNPLVINKFSDNFMKYSFITTTRCCLETVVKDTVVLLLCWGNDPFSCLKGSQPYQKLSDWCEAITYPLHTVNVWQPTQLWSQPISVRVACVFCSQMKNGSSSQPSMIYGENGSQACTVYLD